MIILIVGSGGREYSIGLALKKDKNVEKLYFAPGNGMSNEIGENIEINSFEELAQFAKDKDIDLTIVGPEAPLTNGIVDIFESQGLVIFGPTKEAAKLEGSKAFMKNFLKNNDIPTAKFIETIDYDEACSFIDSLNEPIVVKADGLCAGKGVIIADSKDKAKLEAKKMLSGESFNEAGKKIVVEEFLNGYELSVFAICDGENYKILPAAQDHKRLLDNDKGPNTGGMGAYAPTPLIDDKLYQKIEDRVVKPTLKGMNKINTPYKGVLFIGLMIVDGEPIVLEYNVRFGDPECEVLMPLLKTPASELFYKAAIGKLNELDIKFYNDYCVGVVLASQNYPYESSTPSEITIDKIDDDNIKRYTHISFAGVSKIDGKLFATGGRVLLCIGLGENIKEARNRAYELCEYINFTGKKYRKDIAHQAIRVVN